MNLGMKRLLWKSLLLTASLSLFACDEVPELHPHVADFKLNELREYKVIDKRELKIKFKQSHPLEKAHNMWCLPPSDMVALKEYWKRKSAEGNNNANY